MSLKIENIMVSWENIIRIKGIKLQDKKPKDIENIFSTRQFEKFFLDIDIHIEFEKFPIKKDIPKIESKNPTIKKEYELC